MAKSKKHPTCPICHEYIEQVRDACDASCGRSDSYKKLVKQYGSTKKDICLICYLVRNVIEPLVFLFGKMSEAAKWGAYYAKPRKLTAKEKAAMKKIAKRFV